MSVSIIDCSSARKLAFRRLMRCREETKIKAIRRNGAATPTAMAAVSPVDRPEDPSGAKTAEEAAGGLEEVGAGVLGIAAVCW